MEGVLTGKKRVAAGNRLPDLSRFPRSNCRNEKPGSVNKKKGIKQTLTEKIF